MAKVAWKGGTLLAPVPPALVTCSDGTQDNVLTVAWTGILNSDPPRTYVSIRPTRHSHHIIKESGEFAINLPTKDLVRAVDWCGVFTGAKVDKFERCRLTRTPAEKIACPILAESPLALECRVTDVLSMGSHDVFMADILRVSCHETLLDEKGKIHMERAGLLAYAHGEYYTLGKRVGAFGFSAAKKKKHPPKKAGEGAKKAPKKGGA